MLDRAIQESVSALQCSGKRGQLGSDSGVRQAATRESGRRGGAVRLKGVIRGIDVVPGWRGRRTGG